MAAPDLVRDGPFRVRLPRQGAMRVDGLIYATTGMLQALGESDQALVQVANVACLPGIVGASLAMPDFHWGYGFPIGGVAAFDPDEGGIVSPGGVGYDINCGVRLLRTALVVEDVRPRLARLADALFQEIPSGVGSRCGSGLPKDELRRVLRGGASWAVAAGLGEREDLERIEEDGCLEWADPDAVPERALERGKAQLGSLGSGNHFVEVDLVAEIYDEDVARVFGLETGLIAVQIHTGSRGLGHQTCEEWLPVMLEAARRHGIALPDRQLSCAPARSPEGKQYLGAMAAAANFAFANRQVITHQVRQAIERALGVGPAEHRVGVVYDVCHNIAKRERHAVNGRERELLVHRKGATRALPPGDSRLPACYRPVGQPVLVPGDMGRYSYVLVGTKTAKAEAFASSCHGAGRVLSRKAATRAARGRNVLDELRHRGLLVRAASRQTVVEELPEAYKDVAAVVDVVEGAGLARKVARLEPLAVVKG